MPKRNDVGPDTEVSDLPEVPDPVVPETEQGAKYKIATRDLFFGNVRAHTAGDRVPAENVDRNGWSDGVRKA